MFLVTSHVGACMLCVCVCVCVCVCFIAIQSIIIIILMMMMMMIIIIIVIFMTINQTHKQFYNKMRKTNNQFMTLVCDTDHSASNGAFRESVIYTRT